MRAGCRNCAMSLDQWLDDYLTDKDGLIPPSRDAETGEVLMFAWMNRAALATVGESRAGRISAVPATSKLWHKGEGVRVMCKITRIRIDCTMM